MPESLTCSNRPADDIYQDCIARHGSVCAIARRQDTAPHHLEHSGFRMRIIGPMQIAVTNTMPRPPLRVVVVDDHGIVREGLTALLEKQQGMQVVGSAATGRAAILAAQRLRSDIIIMDLVRTALIRFAVANDLTAL